MSDFTKIAIVWFLAGVVWGALIVVTKSLSFLTGIATCTAGAMIWNYWQLMGC